MIVFVAFSAVYILFLAWSRWYWTETESVEIDSQFVRFSILVPVRNEEIKILELLECIKSQDYPSDQYEVIVIDDQSEDNTSNLVESYFQSNSLDWKLLSVNTGEKGGKKNAITFGVSESKYDHIITTDGDCRFGDKWLRAYASKYSNSDAVMVTGPVKMESRNLFTRLQSLEFSCLIGIGAATLKSGNPTMCNGANLSYKKLIFQEVSGYLGNENIPSGDDEFLLQKIYRKYPGKVSFLKSAEAVAFTDAKQSIGELLNQRIRWSSKWRFHKSIFIKLMALLVFLNYLALFMAGIESFAGGYPMAFLGVVLIRWISLLYFSHPLAQFFRISNVVWISLLLEIIYPFFVFFLGIASIFGKYSWKGRYYS